MKLIPVLILAVVQGVAEFLPISSSGHLALLGHFMGTRSPGNGVLLEVVLHLGTLCSVLFFYRSDLAALARGILRFEHGAVRLLLLLFVASIPAGICGILLGDRVEEAFSSPLLIAVLLGLNGLVLLSAGLLRPRGGAGRAPGPLSALAGGFAQAVALLPGISRSGSTISAITATGVSQEESARFSFFMSIPAIAGAGLLSARDISSIPPGDMAPAAVGFAVSAVVGYLSLRLLIGILGRNRLWVFGVYCIAASIVSAAVILCGGSGC
ncbi:MAG TPA: undecaprenyl-diphosphate phosphatase [Candidatus Fermentibacter daniensis]|nr:undecaprenyl-diphosphate phosphatase [Candidatus Fermentibacter daniensis]HOR07714.1 undecaprenyl-diphosphate phosphatase [Candidatus Fermentibacter daniensis]HPK52117.1 undecaprenyl-diphosphate phosphatase [Candidatus Fermentibacter daniensis]